MSLESTLLVKNKIVLPVKRIRTLQDRIIRLKDNGETPAVIQARDEFEDLDIVLEQK